jgi:hypothetical protein
MRWLVAFLFALSIAAPASARVYQGPSADELVVVPPPTPSGTDAPTRATARGVRERLASLSREVGDCVRQHTDTPPRSLVVHVFVYPSGEWSLALGRVRHRPAAGERGDDPLTICVSNWVGSVLGSRTEPFRGRAPRDVAHTFRFPRS